MKNLVYGQFECVVEQIQHEIGVLALQHWPLVRASVYLNKPGPKILVD